MLSGLVFFFIGLIGSIKKRLTVYYDASDALISLILFSIISYITSFFMDSTPSTAVLIVLLVLNIAFIAYSFYMAYIYNRGRKSFIIAGFVGRYTGSYLLTLVFNFIIIFVIGEPVKDNDLLFLAGNLFRFAMFLGIKDLETFIMLIFIRITYFPSWVYEGAMLPIFIGAITIVCSLVILAFIRRLKFSDFRNYFNLKYLNSLSGELQEQYKKLEYRKPKQNIIKNSE